MEKPFNLPTYEKAFFLLLLAFAACKKTNEPPLGASNGGQSYLSCKINGKQYMVKGKPVGLNPVGVSFNSINIVSGFGDTVKHLTISANDIGKMQANVYLDFGMKPSDSMPLNRRISFSEVTQKEVYVLVESLANVADGYYFAGPDGWINISRADSIGAGTFGFTAWGLDHNGNRLPDSDSIIVTEGRFDIHN